MERIQDFLKELRTRFSSPFFSSFIIAWLIINWQIPVGLLFYKTAEWKDEQGVGYIEYIEHNVRFFDGILWPLISALIYTVVAPVLKNLIRAFTAYVDRKGTDWALAASKGGSIPVEKFIELREGYREKVLELAKVTKIESKYRKESERLSQLADQLRKESSDRGADLEKLRSRSDINAYQGHWE